MFIILSGIVPGKFEIILIFLLGVSILLYPIIMCIRMAYAIIHSNTHLKEMKEDINRIANQLEKISKQDG